MLLVMISGEIIQTDKLKSNVWRKADATIFFAVLYTLICHISDIFDIKSVIMIGFPQLEMFIFFIGVLARIIYLEYKKTNHGVRH